MLIDSEQIAELIAEAIRNKDPDLMKHAYSRPDGEKIYLLTDIVNWFGAKHEIIPSAKTFEDAIRLLHQSGVPTAVIRTAVVFTS